MQKRGQVGVVSSLEKRGQVTVFIIVGVIILAVAGLTYLLVNLSTEERLISESEKALPAEMASVQNYVESCLEQTLEKALIATGKQGGYYVLPEYSSTKAHIDAPFYVYHNVDKMPGIERIEQEVSVYIEDQLLFCLQNFQSFPFMIEFEYPQVDTNIVEGRVAVELFYPLEINVGEKVVHLDLFSSSVPSRLLQIYEASTEITNLSLEYGTGICLDCVGDISEKNNLQIDIVEFKDDQIFYVIKDEQVKIFDQPYYFRFASKYDLSDSPVLEKRRNYNFSEDLVLPFDVLWG